jgi:glutamate-1-semialdehyde 2,1-aminomutase
MYAVRVARSFTNRKKIAKVDGGWHGYTSDLLKTVNWPFNESESSGLVDEKYIVSLPYNNLEKSLEILESVKRDLAGIIVEPVLGGGGAIPATTEYLRGLEQFAHKNGSLFLLDEIVTGYRFRFGCLYPTIGLDPDIVTLGKIVGGGMPIGVIVGKEEILNLANTSLYKKTERSYVGGGTFSANPLSMTAGYATLSYLKEKRESFYKKINSLGEKARKQLTKAFDGKVFTSGKGSLFLTHFLKNGITKVNNATDAAKCDTNLLKRYHFWLIAKHRIFFLPGKLGAFSESHSSNDLKSLIAASEAFSAEINS